jgi:prophage regulatory protein
VSIQQITFIRRPEVLERSGLRKTLMYERMHAGLFPHPIAISERGRAWREDVIDEYNRLIASGATADAIIAFCASVAPPIIKKPLKRIHSMTRIRAAA